MIDLTVQGENLRTAVDFRVASRGAIRGTAGRASVVQPLGDGRRVVSQPESRLAPRSLAVSGFLYGTSPADVIARRDALAARLRQSPTVELGFSDQPGRVYFARFRRVTDSPYPAERPDFMLRLSLTFDLVRPFQYSAVKTVSAIGAAATDIPLGSERTHDLTLIVSGPATDPEIIYETSAGAEVGRIILNANGAGVTLGAGDTLTIAMLTGTIVDQDGANGLSARGEGSIWPLVLDPAHGRGWASPAEHPTLRITAGTLTATYREAY